jgi:outer membrane translocation and assembly module TamA
MFGRHLVFATTEFEYPLQTRVGQVGLATFVDIAQSSRRLVRPLSSPFHVDVGTGIRFSGSGTGKVRLDIGYGIRDGRVRLSAGYAVPWGRR